jgi:SAM-dependent methyltransferase
MTPWDTFFKDKLVKIFQDKKCILDIGGGLRAEAKKGDRYDPSRQWIAPYLQRVLYIILDYIPDYHPDLVGDIHHIPCKSNAVDAVLCIAVLEHIENPFTAIEELYRILKPGGYCFVYVPFIYNYHSAGSLYRDYWRFSADAIEMLFKKFSHIEKQNVRGAFSTWLYISPLGKIALFARITDFLDRLFHKTKSFQTSGYNVFLIK